MLLHTLVDNLFKSVKLYVIKKPYVVVITLDDDFKLTGAKPS